MRRPAGVIGWAIVMGGLIAASTSQGQPTPTPTQTTLAESLFNEGQELMNAGHYDEACPKLAESHRLDPAGGTLLNLAVCHEHQGRLATAWAEYRDALAHAVHDHRPDREDLARARIEALEPVLPRLLVTVPAASATQALVVEVDHVDIGPAAWGTELPLDPGNHVVSATAPGRPTFEQSVALKASDKRQVVVPLLGAAPQTVPAPKGPVPEPDPYQGRRTAGYLLSGGGLVALGVGSWFGIKAIVDRKNSNAKCNPLCGDQAVRLNDDAKRDARIADVGIGLGVVGIAAGAYLILTTPEPPKPTRVPSSRSAVGWQLTPTWTTGGMGVALDSRW